MNKMRKWTWLRRLVQVLVIGLLLSQLFGFKFFSGDLNASNLLGIPLTDPLTALQYLLLGQLAEKILLGALLITAFYWLLGGKTFCSWVCPVNTAGELLDKLRHWLGLPERKLDHGLKYLVLGLVLLLTPILGYPAFAPFNPVGQTSMALAFGLTGALVPLLLVLALELLLYRRGWCRSLCPIGAFYALLGRLSPFVVTYRQDQCVNCRACARACPMGADTLNGPLVQKEALVTDWDCTRCGSCIDVCPQQALQYGWKLKRKGRKDQ